MRELMGILDAIEAMVQTGSRVPLTDKILIDEFRLTQYLNKMRSAIAQGEKIREQVQVGPTSSTPYPEEAAQNDVIAASQKAAQIRHGANEYADQVLSNLQMMVARLQRDLAAVDQNIQNGREFLDKNGRTS
jgi:hypothetical protein